MVSSRTKCRFLSKNGIKSGTPKQRLNPLASPESRSVKIVSDADIVDGAKWLAHKFALILEY